MSELYSALVEKEFEKWRLDKFLAAKTDLSRTRIQELLDGGFVTGSDSSALKANGKIKAGAVYRVTIPPAADAAPVPRDIPLTVLYEDEHLLVVNKPHGFVTHPAPGHRDHTLVNALLHHCKGELSGIGGVKRPGILHRLDKDTSGVMVIAKNDKAHLGLAKQFHDRADALRKIYRVLVWGRPDPAQGVIDAPIGRHPKLRQRMSVTNSGKAALTEYKTLKTFTSKIMASERISLMECALHSGRTHQIRAHAAHIGVFVLGDKVYGKSKIKRGLWPDEVYALNRQALHAHGLGFRHPITSRDMYFEAPLPDDMANLLAILSR